VQQGTIFKEDGLITVLVAYMSLMEVYKSLVDAVMLELQSLFELVHAKT
jgi:hypothetical protein